jgi:hypothetical protein
VRRGGWWGWYRWWWWAALGGLAALMWRSGPIKVPGQPQMGRRDQEGVWGGWAGLGVARSG